MPNKEVSRWCVRSKNVWERPKVSVEKPKKWNLPRGLNMAATPSPMFFRYSILAWEESVAPVDDNTVSVREVMIYSIVKNYSKLKFHTHVNLTKVVYKRNISCI